MKKKAAYLLVNGITLYRLVASPVLIFLIFTKELDIFKWLLAVSFFTDMIDGFLARRLHVTSILGAKLDSIADDLTIVAGITGLFVFKYSFIREESWWIIGVLGLFAIQTTLALIRYRKISSFHTYMAKLAALFQGTFLILMFFLPSPVYFLFYAAIFITALELIEEIVLVMMLPQWKTNVKGIYWVMRERSGRQ